MGVPQRERTRTDGQWRDSSVGEGRGRKDEDGVFLLGLPSRSPQVKTDRGRTASSLSTRYQSVEDPRAGNQDEKSGLE